MADACTIVVDGRAYEVEPSEESTRARHGDLALRLPVWTGARHLDALRRHLVPGPAGLELDGEGYAAEILAHTEAPVERWHELVPLALWWATRPDLDPAPSDATTACDGAGVDLHGGARAQLRDCTWQQRLAAAREGLLRSDEGAAVDPVRVMGRLLAQVVESVEAPGRGRVSLEELGASSLVRLWGVVLDRCSRQPPFAALLDLEDGPAPARRLLELCRALGRTPTQVLELPAAEVDLVCELVRRAEAAMPSRTPVASRAHAPLHDASDAVVIHFGDGGST